MFRFNESLGNISLLAASQSHTLNFALIWSVSGVLRPWKSELKVKLCLKLHMSSVFKSASSCIRAGLMYAQTNRWGRGSGASARLFP